MKVGKSWTFMKKHDNIDEKVLDFFLKSWYDFKRIIVGGAMIWHMRLTCFAGLVVAQKG
jgi:hypothetical protein